MEVDGPGEGGWVPSVPLLPRQDALPVNTPSGKISSMALKYSHPLLWNAFILVWPYNGLAID